ncbi:MAG: DUF4405 domain-containing protein [bacterium]|jgi:hypothetical protein
MQMNGSQTWRWVSAIARAVPLRAWATPLTIASFFLISATGILMFFDRNEGLIAPVHEAFSWVFLAASAAHTALHFRAFRNHLRSWWGKATIGACAVLLAASFSSWGVVTGHQILKPVRQALIHARVSTLADLTGTTPEMLLRRLEAHGIAATSGHSVRELSAKYGVSEVHLLSIVFQGRTPLSAPGPAPDPQ